MLVTVREENKIIISVNYKVKCYSKLRPSRSQQGRWITVTPTPNTPSRLHKDPKRSGV